MRILLTDEDHAALRLLGAFEPPGHLLQQLIHRHLSKVDRHADSGGQGRTNSGKTNSGKGRLAAWREVR
jgi:hypothetical protein